MAFKDTTERNAMNYYISDLHIGIINRVKEIPQLGVIKVAKRLAKTRYDYIMLQLYLHQMICVHK